MLVLDHFGATDAGKVRQNNEDSLLTGTGRDHTLFAVADGIGGFEAGETASSIAVEALKETGPEDSLRETIEDANRRILEAARQDSKLHGMGTTVVAVRFSGTNERPVAEIAHVGDSRAYLLRQDGLHSLTEDHSFVEELVKSGDITRAQAFEHPQKNLITRALGAEERVEVDVSTLSVQEGDRILLCSDGLTDMISEERIEETLLEESENPENAARRLLSESLEAGGQDNVTAVVADIKESPGAPQGVYQADDTRELELFSEEAHKDPHFPRNQRGRGGGRRRKRRVGGMGSRALGRLVRALAVVLVLVVAATPFYVWGQSRYFMSFDGERLVVNQGLPYEAFGVELNRQWRETDIQRSEVKQPYQEPIEEHQLYSKDRVQAVLGDLEE